ncbi:MAG: hypothetical protein HYV07_08925 [Deltaproteobacteria bacterium]|nr:hypothetical protein [Deltaproteobacteria bacterium]
MSPPDLDRVDSTAARPRLVPVPVLSSPGANETSGVRDPGARWTEIDAYRYHFKFFGECEAEIKKLVPEDRRAAVKASGIMYLAHDADDLTTLNKMAGEAHRRTAGYSPMNRARYAEGAALLSLQDRSGAGDTELTLFDFGPPALPKKLAERLGRKLEANMSDPQTLMDMVVMCKRVFPNAEISVYANGHSRSVFLGAFSDHHPGDPADFDPASGGKRSPHDIMSYPALAKTLLDLSTRYGIRIGALGLLACGTGALEIVRQFVPDEGCAPAARYLVVSEDALTGSSTAWIDLLAPRNGYDAGKLAKAMGRAVFDDGVREDRTTGHRVPHAVAVLDLDKARGAYDALACFQAAASAAVLAYPRAFMRARNETQRMKGSGSIDFSAQVDAKDFIERVARNVLAEALATTHGASVEPAFEALLMDGSLPPGLDEPARKLLLASHEVVSRLDELVVQASTPTPEAWAERWDGCEMKSAHGLSFFLPGATTGDDGFSVRSHATGRFSDSSAAGALEVALPGFGSLGFVELGKRIDSEARRIARSMP